MILKWNHKGGENMSYGYGRSYESGSKSSFIMLIAILVFVLIWLQICKSFDRSANNMVLIYDNYVYNEETFIIYNEYDVGHNNISHSYTPYIDKNGHMCRYEVSTGNWIAFIETEEGMKDVGISTYGYTQRYSTDE